ncbi:hypothetical protein DV738_g2801, partial [Chaetothyriales sp. CBS 135597]
MIPGEFEYQQELQKPLASYPNLRTVIDTIPDFELFVYHFLATDLLQLGQKPLSLETRRGILRSALTGLAELHDRGIVHNDIKPNNILLDYEETSSDDLTIKSVQISDLEDAVLLQPGRNLRVVAIYVMVNEMVFRVNDTELSSDDAWWHILRRHISFFGDEGGFEGLLQHIGEENVFFDRLIALASDFDSERPRQPFAKWHYVDAGLRDLVVKMTNLDPAKRITAREALDHPWFRETCSSQKT